MKLFYISPRGMRKNRADPVHIMKTCASISEHGVDVELVTPRYIHRGWRVSKVDIWDQYGIVPSFRIIELPTIILGGSWIEKTEVFQRFLLISIFYLFIALKTMLIKLRRPIFIYSKCYISTLPAIWIKRIFRLPWVIIFEKADWNPNKWIHKYVCLNVNGIVAINNYISEQIAKIYHVKPNKLHTMRFYSDIHSILKNKVSKEEARKKLILPERAYIVIYTGKIYPFKQEIIDIIEAAYLNPDKLFILVGARESVINFYLKYLKERGQSNVIIREFQPLTILYLYLQAADLLISYYENDFFSSYCRVPNKLSLYICVQRPVILADLPSLRSIIEDRDSAYFVKPNSPILLSQAIKYLAENRLEANQRAENLFKFACANDLKKFAKNIIDFISACQTT